MSDTTSTPSQEAALSAEEDRLRRMSKVFMDAADPIIIEDLTGVVIEMNR